MRLRCSPVPVCIKCHFKIITLIKRISFIFRVVSGVKRITLPSFVVPNAVRKLSDLSDIYLGIYQEIIIAISETGVKGPRRDIAAPFRCCRYKSLGTFTRRECPVLVSRPANLCLIWYFQAIRLGMYMMIWTYYAVPRLTMTILGPCIVA